MLSEVNDQVIPRTRLGQSERISADCEVHAVLKHVPDH